MPSWTPANPTAPIDDEYRHETPRANRALCDYCLLGSARSLQKLIDSYVSDSRAPTHSLDTLKKWSLNYDWGIRVQLFDYNLWTEEARVSAERRREIIETGLALKVERIEKLKLAYHQLEGYISQPDYVWPCQVKRIPVPGGGFELVETRRFNAELFSQLRGILADIARETNDPELYRIPAPDETPCNYALLTQDELHQLLTLLKKATPAPTPSKPPYPQTNP